MNFPAALISQRRLQFSVPVGRAQLLESGKLETPEQLVLVITRT